MKGEKTYEIEDGHRLDNSIKIHELTTGWYPK